MRRNSCATRPSLSSTFSPLFVGMRVATVVDDCHYYGQSFAFSPLFVGMRVATPNRMDLAEAAIAFQSPIRRDEGCDELKQTQQELEKAAFSPLFVGMRVATGLSSAATTSGRLSVPYSSG